MVAYAAHGPPSSLTVPQCSTNCIAPQCAHGTAEGDQPYWDENLLQMVYPSEEETPYPWQLCQAYAKAAAEAWSLEQHVKDVLRAVRETSINHELSRYTRLQDEALCTAMCERIYDMESSMVPGAETEHLARLLRCGHYRGTDVRLTLEHAGERAMFPYPAYRWLWRDMMSFRWRQEAHINVLEAQALLAHVRRPLREWSSKKKRFFIVVDSQFFFYAMGKGRSASTRLNRLLRRLNAMVVAGDLYLFPVWTLSAWNFADRPSRR